ncbi:MAG TPA: hypothetical protein VHL98_13535 [Microvirga sp.]|jgi:hypothetical protein|nr:hypothetical protein [Microvirga sp.]
MGVELRTGVDRNERSGGVVWLTSLPAASGRCDLSAYPDLEQALVSPSAVFARPDDVVRHPLLSLICKREILWRWAWDEYLVDLAQAEGMPEGLPSRLDEVRTALQMLGDTWSPDPAAPAVRLLILKQEPLAQAA